MTMTPIKGGALMAALVLALTGSCPPPVTTPPPPAEVTVPTPSPAACPAPTLMAEDGSCVNPNYWDPPVTPPPNPEPPACKVD